MKRALMLAAAPLPGFAQGTALARRLAALHGGTIEVESEPGKGSTFALYLPIREKSRTKRRNPRGYWSSTTRTETTGCSLRSSRPRAIRRWNRPSRISSASPSTPSCLRRKIPCDPCFHQFCQGRVELGRGEALLQRHFVDQAMTREFAGKLAVLLPAGDVLG